MKNKAEHKILFGPGGCLTREAIEAYIDKSLSDGELKKVRSHAKNCQLCADSLEGAGLFKSSLSYSRRIGQMNQSRFRRDLNHQGRSRRLFLGITSAAASIALLLGIFYILKYQNLFERPDILAEKTGVAEEKVIQKDQTGDIDLYGEHVETESKPVSKIGNEKKTDYPQAIPQLPKEDITIKGHVVELDEIEDMDYDYDETLSEIEPISVEKEMEETEGEKAEFKLQLKSKSLGRVEDKREQGYYTNAPAARSENKSAKKTFYVAEVKPLFRGGGTDEFSKYIADSLKVILPDTVLTQSVVVGFRIDTSGNVKNVKLISGTESVVLNNQIISIIENSPQWVPASISGKPVDSDQEIRVVLAP